MPRSDRSPRQTLDWILNGRVITSDAEGAVVSGGAVAVRGGEIISVPPAEDAMTLEQVGVSAQLCMAQLIRSGGAKRILAGRVSPPW